MAVNLKIWYQFLNQNYIDHSGNTSSQPVQSLFYMYILITYLPFCIVYVQNLFTSVTVQFILFFCLILRCLLKRQEPLLVETELQMWINFFLSFFTINSRTNGRKFWYQYCTIDTQSQFDLILFLQFKKKLRHYFFYHLHRYLNTGS